MSDYEKDGSQDRVKTSEKKPYQKPAFEREGVFETMALTCGKIPAGCNGDKNGKHS